MDLNKMVVEKKLVLVGPSYIGKTSLLQAALQGRYPPTEQIFEQPPGCYECTVLKEAGEGEQVKLALWDTAGAWDYDRLRPLTYPHASVIVIGFAIDRPDYFDLTEEMWLPEIDHFAPGVPIILVGLRKDARDDPNPDDPREISFISKELGEKTANRIGALTFIECSSFTGEGVKEVFEAAARAALFGPPRKIKKTKERKGRSRAQCVVF
ncbi:P-loop containing nucleoside triphosphate hydrolase protein [Dactylonectria macrodidyma]|uniref:P-loop containing nucleoside triphosphate hydrolase protein n=1 Tax=Dactylonectria macrodidyma TaxID=307937 RepID=A0A9P9D419_9HYPO|nr:P-loop containing nucleoside triphosphate hydrolase protein [Dactylonectria macrodidyma]